MKAAASQFGAVRLDIRRAPYLSSTAEIAEVLAEAEGCGAAVAYTLVRPHLKEFLEKRARELNLLYVDIMGPLIDALQNLTGTAPKCEPGLIRKMDDEYFGRVEAIEFAVKYDDGKEARGILRADVVIIGVSRTSKTPLCMYLALKGIKAANIPLVPEVEPPEELFRVPAKRVIGLTVKPELLFEVRKERLSQMGLSHSANYGSLDRINAELEYAAAIMRRIGCPVIDVTSMAVEETAAKIIEIYTKGGNN